MWNARVRLFESHSTNGTKMGLKNFARGKLQNNFSENDSRNQSNNDSFRNGHSAPRFGVMTSCNQF